MNIFKGIYHKVLAPVGKFFKIVFDDGKTLEENIPLYIQATDDAVKDAPTIVEDTAALISAVTGGAAIFHALDNLGLDPLADIDALQTAYADFKTYWPNLKAAVTTELTTLGADAAQIESIFAPADTTADIPAATGSDSAAS